VRRPQAPRRRAGHLRALAARRATRVSWPRELARATLALANAAALTFVLAWLA
jgi:hypothetical protein